MKVLVVLAHPEPKSFNAAMYQTAMNAFAENGHEVRTTDLYAMSFNPVYDRSNFITVRNRLPLLKLLKQPKGRVIGKTI